MQLTSNPSLSILLESDSQNQPFVTHLSWVWPNGFGLRMEAAVGHFLKYFLRTRVL